MDGESGEGVKQKFKPGKHSIAVRVIDNEGMDNTMILTLKVNGKVEHL